LYGFGGLLGITALTSVIAALGISWISAGLPLGSAKSA